MSNHTIKKSLSKNPDYFAFVKHSDWKPPVAAGKLMHGKRWSPEKEDDATCVGDVHMVFLSHNSTKPLSSCIMVTFLPIFNLLIRVESNIPVVITPFSVIHIPFAFLCVLVVK